MRRPLGAGRLSRQGGFGRALAVALAASVAAPLVLGCADAGADASETAEPIDPHLSVIEQRIFARSCTFSSCHGGTAPKEGLLLVAPTHGALVNQPSNAVPARTLVVPGDPGASYLLEKLIRDDPAAGERMPDANPPLEAAAITAIEGWIAAGALDD